MISLMNSKTPRSEAAANWALQSVETPSWQRPSVQRNRAVVQPKRVGILAKTIKLLRK